MPLHIRRIDALLLLMTIIWGTNYAIVKHAFAEIDPQAFNAIRVIVASAVFLADDGGRSGVLPPRRRRRGFVRERPLHADADGQARRARPCRARRWSASVSISTGSSAGWRSDERGKRGADSRRCTPVLIALMGAAHWRRARRPPTHWLGAALSLAGIYIVVGRGVHVGGSDVGRRSDDVRGGLLLGDLHARIATR